MKVPKDKGVDVTVHAGKGVRLYDRTFIQHDIALAMFILVDPYKNPTASGQIIRC